MIPRLFMLWLAVLLLAVGGTAFAAPAQSKARQGLAGEAQRAAEDGNWELAVRRYREAFALAPGSVREYGKVAEILRQLERPDEAVAMLREGIRQHPGDWGLKVELGTYLAGAGKFEEAYEHFNKLDKAARDERPDPRDDSFYFGYGVAAERTGRLEESVRLFERAVALAPVEELPQRAARSINYLGYVLLKLDRDVERAVELIHQANELHPDCGAYVDSLGWSCLKVGQYPEALRELLRAEALMKAEGNMDPEVLDHIAQAYFRLGHRDKALEYVRRAQELAPEEKEYQARFEEYQKAATVDPVPLDFLQTREGGADKRRGRRR